ncbi:MAG: hypothetical protein HY401_02350 [Elusimicrobia bacterium]|nr:hypothetical protein [Elusimicrobiota bacterium]
MIRFDLDFGFYEIRQAQAYLNDRFPSIRLPVSVSRSGAGYEEIDFAEPALRIKVLELVKEKAGKAGKAMEAVKVKTGKPSVRLVSLEKFKSSRGSRIGKGELWLDEKVAVRFSLMKSKWSYSPRGWWIAFPSQWKKDSQAYQDLFVVKDKSLKKEITALVRETYLERYGDGE